MDGFYLAALAIEQALDMHQAAGIIGHNVLSTSLRCCRALHLTHGGRDHWKFCGESTPKPTAGFVSHFNELQFPYVTQQFSWLFLHTQLTKPMTSVMKCYLGWKPRSKIYLTQFGHKKVGELIAFFSQGFRFGFMLRPGKELGIEHLHHRAA